MENSYSYGILAIGAHKQCLSWPQIEILIKTADRVNFLKTLWLMSICVEKIFAFIHSYIAAETVAATAVMEAVWVLYTCCGLLGLFTTLQPYLALTPPAQQNTQASDVPSVARSTASVSFNFNWLPKENKTQ